MGKSPIKIVIVDDHPVVLEGLSAGLSGYKHIQVVGTAVDLQGGRQLVDAGGFDQLVTDLYLSEIRDGLQLIRYACKKNPDCKIVVLTYSTQPEDIFDANRAGADAYLVKDTDLDEIARALTIVQEGGRPALKPELEAALWSKLKSALPAELPYGLNEREWQVLSLITNGATNEEIAEKLFITPRVVRRTNTSIYRKLHVRNRSEAIARATKEGWF